MGFKENDRFGLFGLWYAKDMHSIRCSRVKIGKPLGSSFAYTKCFPFLGIIDYSKTTCPRKTAVLFGLHALDHWHGQELWIPEGQAMNRLSAASVYSKIGYQWTYGQTKWALTDHPRNLVSRRGNDSWKSSSKPLVPMTHWPICFRDLPQVTEFTVPGPQLHGNQPWISWFFQCPHSLRIRYGTSKLLWLISILLRWPQKWGGTVYPIFTHTHINQNCQRMALSKNKRTKKHKAYYHFFLNLP